MGERRLNPHNPTSSPSATSRRMRRRSAPLSRRRGLNPKPSPLHSLTQEDEKKKRTALKEARIAFLEEEVPALVAKGATLGEGELQGRGGIAFLEGVLDGHFLITPLLNGPCCAADVRKKCKSVNSKLGEKFEISDTEVITRMRVCTEGVSRAGVAGGGGCIRGV